MSMYISSTVSMFASFSYSCSYISVLYMARANVKDGIRYMEHPSLFRFDLNIILVLGMDVSLYFSLYSSFCIFSSLFPFCVLRYR